LSDVTVDFLKGCLQVEEKDRMSWNEIFVHGIFKGCFLNRADENREFENKMKSIMTKLRYYFHLNREDLEHYLTKYGYKEQEELSFESYYEFLKVANPNITYNEAVYIFKKTDLDGNGAISLEEILTMLKNYGIAV
jgi:Ca2+-binding EF-hand superfamily protein